MSHDDQRRCYQQLRADQQLVDQAASELRQRAIRAGYAGAERKQVAFALALVLGELDRHVRDLDDPLRQHVVEACGQLLGRT